MSYKNPFPGRDLTATVDVAYERSYTRSDGGTDTVYPSIFAVDTPAGLALHGLTPYVTPVTIPTVNGVPYTQDLNGVGNTPRVAWGVPVTGTPAYYSVTFQNVDDSSDLTTFQTTDTQLQIPPDILKSGRKYLLTLTAVLQGPSLQPGLEGLNYYSLPFGQADYLAGAVQP